MANSAAPSTSALNSTGDATPRQNRSWALLGWGLAALALGLLALLPTLRLQAELLQEERSLRTDAEDRSFHNYWQMQRALAQTYWVETELSRQRREVRILTGELALLQANWLERNPGQSLPAPRIEDGTGRQFQIQGWPRPVVISRGRDRLVLLETAAPGK